MAGEAGTSSPTSPTPPDPSASRLGLLGVLILSRFFSEAFLDLGGGCEGGGGRLGGSLDRGEVSLVGVDTLEVGDLVGDLEVLEPEPGDLVLGAWLSS